MSQGKQKHYIKPQVKNTLRSKLNAGQTELELGDTINSSKQKRSSNNIAKEREKVDNITPVKQGNFRDSNVDIDIGTIGDFDIESVPRNACMLWIASRRSGKSHGCQHFLEVYTKKHKTDGIFLFSLTNAGFPGIPSVYRYKNLDMLEELISVQIKVKKHNQKAKKKDKISSSIIIILDDMVGGNCYTGQMRKNPILNKLFVNGRHLSSDCGSSNMMVILISQVFIALSPQIRLNTDYLFTTKTASRKERENMVNTFLSLNSGRRGLAESYEVFDSIVNKAEFNWLVVHCTAQNKKIFSDYCFNFKAPNTLENRRLVGDNEDWINNRKEIYW